MRGKFRVFYRNSEILNCFVRYYYSWKKRTKIWWNQIHQFGICIGIRLLIPDYHVYTAVRFLQKNEWCDVVSLVCTGIPYTGYRKYYRIHYCDASVRIWRSVPGLIWKNTELLLDKPIYNSYHVEVTASRSFRFSPQVPMKRFTKVAYFK